MASSDPNWPAIEAVGTWAAALTTLGAVLLALYPVLAERRRGRKLATNLRARLATEMVALRPTLKLLAERPKDWGPAAIIRLSDASATATEAIGRVLELIQRADLLSPTEHDALVILGVNLRMLEEARGADEETAKNLLALHDAAFDQIAERHSVLRGRVPTLPWDEVKVPTGASDPYVYAVKYPDRLIAVNRGTSPAFDVNLVFDGDRSPVVGRQDLPISELPPGEQREIPAAFSKDYYPPFDAELRWKGGAGGKLSYTRKQTVELRR